ncbi:hypothetical protein WICPIJ_007569 [Wickerhamomyces pijperi]|uniref:Uncharacterized protein n=1 Tax=Wickerhamomyces pijperi TaxID=599730 RepID=A0A9P8Q1H2_WICPI|nr:hypothetical protein WICPIJ_007569 [Wickerhamomyces pijperi]
MKPTTSGKVDKRDWKASLKVPNWYPNNQISMFSHIVFFLDGHTKDDKTRNVGPTSLFVTVQSHSIDNVQHASHLQDRGFRDVQIFSILSFQSLDLFNDLGHILMHASPRQLIQPSNKPVDISGISTFISFCQRTHHNKERRSHEQGFVSIGCPGYETISVGFTVGPELPDQILTG